MPLEFLYLHVLPITQELLDPIAQLIKQLQLIYPLLVLSRLPPRCRQPLSLPDQHPVIVLLAVPLTQPVLDHLIQGLEDSPDLGHLSLQVCALSHVFLQLPLERVRLVEVGRLHTLLLLPHNQEFLTHGRELVRLLKILLG